MIVHCTALVERPAACLFDLIEAAENYPRFLPWCEGANIVARDDLQVCADIRVRYRGVGFEMRTRNPKRRPEYMAIHLERGPFRNFEGEWFVTALTEQACKVEFRLDYEFDSALMTRIAGPMFHRVSDTLVDAFVREAERAPSPAEPPPEPAAAAPSGAADPAAP